MELVCETSHSEYHSVLYCSDSCRKEMDEGTLEAYAWSPLWQGMALNSVNPLKIRVITQVCIYKKHMLTCFVG